MARYYRPSPSTIQYARRQYAHSSILPFALITYQMLPT